MKKSAIISACGQYRYRLTRGEGRLMPVVMLNPSTADADVDDPTIRRLLGFASRGMKTENGLTMPPFDGVDVVNLYALRSTSPKGLAHHDPYGPDNNRVHHRAFCETYGSGIIVAWGTNASWAAGHRFFRELEKTLHPSNAVSCFGMTKDGHPKHPLYLPGDTVLQPFTWQHFLA